MYRITTRSDYQLTQWTVPTGKPIESAYISVDTPTCDVTMITRDSNVSAAPVPLPVHVVVVVAVAADEGVA